MARKSPPAQERTLLRLGLAAIAAGVALRLAAPLLMDLHDDGVMYLIMGRSWASRHDFLLPFGDVTFATTPVHSHHYPPGYPTYLGAVFSVFGTGLWQAKWAAVAMALAALAVVYACTRDLYGRVPAALVTGLLAVEPHLVWATGTGFSENMAVALFALTMWAIVRSLRDDRYILLAGLFAGLAYLTRAGLGYFFVVAGLGGFLWRFYHKRWKAVTNPWYLGAIAIFASIFLAWARRNVSLFGWPHWETSAYFSAATRHALAHPGLLAGALVAKLPLFVLFLAPYLWVFRHEARGAAKRARDEETSALWLSVLLVWLVAWIVSAVFWTYEQTPLWWIDNHRYVVLGIVPLGWLLLRDVRPERRAAGRYAAIAMALLLVSVAVAANPERRPDAAAGAWMDPHVRPGDQVGVVNLQPSALFPYLREADAVTFVPLAYAERSSEWIVTVNSAKGGGNYTLAATFHQAYLFEPDKVLRVWARNDVVAERGLEIR